MLAFCLRAQSACALHVQALEKGAFKAGQRVLIQAGSGGVGSWLVQLAKSRGLHVTATCSTPNIDYCKKVSIARGKKGGGGGAGV